MSLTSKQIALIRKPRTSTEDVDALFPEVLHIEDWENVLELRRKSYDKKGTTIATSLGVCWIDNGVIHSEKWGKRPRSKLRKNEISMLLVHAGTGWHADSLLWLLAHSQLGISRPAALASGVVTVQQTLEELMDKLQRARAVAKIYIEELVLPPAFRAELIAQIESPESLAKWTAAVRAAPKPKFPSRHVRAENLFEGCDHLLEMLNSKTHSFGDWLHLVDRAFEAGKAYAYLEQLKDPNTLKDNLKGAKMVGRPASTDLKLIEEAWFALCGELKSVPKAKNIRARLGMVECPGESGNKATRYKLKNGREMLIKDFWNHLRNIRRRSPHV